MRDPKGSRRLGVSPLAVACILVRPHRGVLVEPTEGLGRRRSFGRRGHDRVADVTNIVQNVGGDRTHGHRHRARGHEQPHVRARAVGRRGHARGRRVHERPPPRGAAPGLAEANVRGGVPMSSSVTGRSRDEYIFDFSFPEEAGDPNPHLWTDPLYAKRYAEMVQDSCRPRSRPTPQRTMRTTRRSPTGSTSSTGSSRRSPRPSRPSTASCSRTTTPSRTSRASTGGGSRAMSHRDFADPHPQEVADADRPDPGRGVRRSSARRCSRAPVLEQIAAETGRELRRRPPRRRPPG